MGTPAPSVFRGTTKVWVVAGGDCSMLDEESSGALRWVRPHINRRENIFVVEASDCQERRLRRAVRAQLQAVARLCQACSGSEQMEAQDLFCDLPCSVAFGRNPILGALVVGDPLLQKLIEASAIAKQRSIRDPLTAPV